MEMGAATFNPFIALKTLEKTPGKHVSFKVVDVQAMEDMVKILIGSNIITSFKF